jgi:hypothetical protein
MNECITVREDSGLRVLNMFISEREELREELKKIV